MIKYPIKILVAIGTRPEAIKMAPVIFALQALPGADLIICSTGQHQSMLDDVLNIFNITPHYRLNIMKENQTLADITNGVMTGITDVIKKESPDWILVHGDTTTTFAASLAAFYCKVKIGHVEAGLRSFDMENPWPEEANRRLASVLTDFHFAPTVKARSHLIREGVNPATISVTGNTVIDALQIAKGCIENDARLRAELQKRFAFLNPTQRSVLVTAHRRENHGMGLENICHAIRTIASSRDVQFIFPVHLNPKVKKTVHSLLDDLRNVHLIEPLDYPSFVYAMNQSQFILTDSGGIQEEAPALGKPVLVMRETSERMEAVEAGTAKLVGTDINRIVSESLRLLDDENAYALMSQARNPFGNGQAGKHIQEYFEGLMRGHVEEKIEVNVY